MKGENRKSNRLRRLARDALIVAHDVLWSQGAYLAAAGLILPIQQFAGEAASIVPFAIAASMVAGFYSYRLGVFSTRWRLASLTDFVTLIESSVATIVTLLLFRALLHLIYVEPFFSAEIRVFCLGGALALGGQAIGRIAYRYFRFLRGRKVQFVGDATIFVGAVSEAESTLRSVDHEIVKSNVVACLVPRGDRLGRDIRGRPILGTSDDLERAVGQLAASGIDATALLLSPTILAKREEAQHLQRLGRRCGLRLLKVETVGVGGRSEIHFDEFLFRSRRRIDTKAIDAFVGGKSLLITGGGGTIGGDIALRAAAHGAVDIILLDMAEQGLQARLLQIRREHPACRVRGLLCDIRDRNRLIRVLREAKPDIVVHAAALKHVDLVEENWREAVLTNVLGTRNLLDAADAAHTPVLINISTDKAADPVGMLGFTKRAGEILVAGRAKTSPFRRYSVRFGNVLGSSGSVIDVFLSQIAAGGPITITDPQVKRFFMSRNEAAELVLASGSCSPHASLYLLDMGEQISIQDLAEELITWSGSTRSEIAIEYIGLRPGERREERLFGVGEAVLVTDQDGIRAVDVAARRETLDSNALQRALDDDDKDLAIRAMSVVSSPNSASSQAEWAERALA